MHVCVCSLHKSTVNILIYTFSVFIFWWCNYSDFLFSFIKTLSSFHNFYESRFHFYYICSLFKNKCICFIQAYKPNNQFLLSLRFVCFIEGWIHKYNFLNMKFSLWNREWPSWTCKCQRWTILNLCQPCCRSRQHVFAKNHTHRAVFLELLQNFRWAQTLRGQGFHILFVHFQEWHVLANILLGLVHRILDLQRKENKVNEK